MSFRFFFTSSMHGYMQWKRCICTTFIYIWSDKRAKSLVSATTCMLSLLMSNTLLAKWKEDEKMWWKITHTHHVIRSHHFHLCKPEKCPFFFGPIKVHFRWFALKNLKIIFAYYFYSEEKKKISRYEQIKTSYIWCANILLHWLWENEKRDRTPKLQNERMNEWMNERHNEIIKNERTKQREAEWDPSLFCFTYLSSMNSK